MIIGFRAPNSLEAQLEFEIDFCNTVRHPENWKECLLQRKYDIWLIMDGTVELLYENERYTLRKGDVFLMCPNVCYEAHGLNGQPCEFMYIWFGLFIGRHIRSLDLLYGGKISADDIAFEVNLVLDYYERYEKQEAMSTLNLKAAITLLISKTISMSQALSTSERAKPERLRKALLYISDNLETDLTVKEIANHVDMSEKYFITWFMGIMGITPYRYAVTLKMQRAYIYLREDGCSVSKTAEKLGYMDPYVFSKAFKKHFGFPPSHVCRQKEE